MQLAGTGKVHDNSQKWIDLIAKYRDLQALDETIVNEICEKILIHEHYMIDGRWVQKIEIYSRFIGKLLVTREYYNYQEFYSIYGAGLGKNLYAKSPCIMNPTSSRMLS